MYRKLCNDVLVHNEFSGCFYYTDCEVSWIFYSCRSILLISKCCTVLFTVDIEYESLLNGIKFLTTGTYMINYLHRFSEAEVSVPEASNKLYEWLSTRFFSMG